MRTGAFALLGLSLALTTGLLGCRDLSVPDDKLGATDPSGIPITDNLLLIEPNSAAISSPLPRSVFFRIRASAKNGVRSVSVRCGEVIELGRWQTPVAAEGENTSVLIEDRIEFDRCVAGSLELAGIKDIALVIAAEDTTQLQVGKIEQTVRIDFSVPVAPVISVKALDGSDIGQSLTSGQPLRFEVRSKDELRVPPQVRVDGKLVDVVAADPVERPNTWLVESQPLYLGGKRLDPGVEANTAVLEETHRTVPLEVIAQNRLGYEARLELGVPLRRIVWERNVPGKLALDAGTPVFNGPPHAYAPVVTAEGLTVPIWKDLNNPGVGWLPGFFDQANGAFESTPLGLFPSWSGLAIDHSGGAILRSSDGTVVAVGFKPTSLGTPGPDAVDGLLYPLFPAQGKACSHQAIGDEFSCTNVADHSLACYGEGHDPTAPTLLAADFDATVDPGSIQFAAGPNIYSLGGSRPATCGLNPGSFRITDQGIEVLDFVVPNGHKIDRVYPLERGDFGIFTRDTSSAAIATFTHWGLSGSTREGELVSLPSYVDQGGLSRIDTPVAFRPNGTVLFFPEEVTTSGITRISGFGPEGSKAGSADFYGYYEMNSSGRGSLYPHDVVTVIDGADLATSRQSTTYLLVQRNGSFSGQYSVLAVDENTRAVWVYHYPLAIPSFQGRPMLVGSSQGKHLYLIDPVASAVVALAR